MTINEKITYQQNLQALLLADSITVQEFLKLSVL